ncbi:hypothetical protein RclHR1_00840021 [Rhizophagus clarus]|uniref:Uncharacterized protein n=1 Tax=Rhizophagus clarus TaxID=94130 RepID=A0A2Z6SF43_9GLOM|nr:hypothetical protein RclHR1_00840021 [Rhizophagus clarus]
MIMYLVMYLIQIKQWNLPVHFELQKFGARYTPMPNNSVFVIKQENASGNWNIYSSELPLFLEGALYGSVKLDVEDSKLYLNLRSEEKKKIKDSMVIELSETASVSSDRIKATDKEQIDQEQVILSFSISAMLHLNPVQTLL